MLIVLIFLFLDSVDFVYFYFGTLGCVYVDLFMV